VAEERLQKILAHAGIASRRASEELIVEGRVTVDGEVAILGMRADAVASDIRVDGERVNTNPELIYLMLNKPQGVLTTADDPEGRPTVMDLVNVTQRLFPVGRLDMDTEGLLLMTNDGELAHALMHPSFEVRREYLALVPGPVRKRTLAQLRDGVELDDGLARPIEIEVLEEARSKALLRVVMAEGRKREVRRMLGAVGLHVERLARTTYGGVEIGELRQGKWRFLTQLEVGMLYRAIEQRGGGGQRIKERRASRDERRARGGPDGAPVSAG